MHFIYLATSGRELLPVLFISPRAGTDTAADGFHGRCLVVLFVHPAHVEAVAWISSRKDLVAAAFLLACVLAYLKYRQRGL